MVSGGYTVSGMVRVVSIEEGYIVSGMVRVVMVRVVGWYTVSGMVHSGMVLSSRMVHS